VSEKEREREMTLEKVEKVRKKKSFINCKLQQILCGRLNEGRKSAGHVVIMGNTGKTYSIVVENKKT
jgi:uncharacterized coiled-coil DUF342 family protein